jgi:hypothetical protein
VPAAEQAGNRLTRQEGEARCGVLQAHQPVQAHVHALVD